MGQSIAYAYLKTIDGQEVMEYTKEAFEKVLETLRYRESKKSDRVLYFVTDNTHINGINFFKEDYFELLH